MCIVSECNGTYGVNCSLDCHARNCMNTTSSCDSNTGKCIGGCKPGWLNDTCTSKCSPQYFGEDCLKLCSARNCHGDQGCHHETGSCVDGCIAGWEGMSCETKSKAFAMYFMMLFWRKLLFGV